VQPTTANVGETITVTVNVEMDETAGGAGGGPSAGITAVLMPIDWTVVDIEFDGDYGPETMVFLHPDSADRQPAKGTDFWYDSLVVNYPPPAGMDWYVYQGVDDHYWLGDTQHVTVTYQLTTGAAGNDSLRYMASCADISFNESEKVAVSEWKPITVGTTAIDDVENGVVKGFALKQNFPNPFNPSTTIRYEVNQRALVNLSVYDLTGKQVTELVNSIENTGSHEIKFDATNLPSGVYLYKLTAGSFVQMKKMVLIK